MSGRVLRRARSELPGYRGHAAVFGFTTLPAALAAFSAARAGPSSETAQDVPEIVANATARWMYMTSWLTETSDEVAALHRSILDGLKTGALVPERPQFVRFIVNAARNAARS